MSLIDWYNVLRWETNWYIILIYYTLNVLRCWSKMTVDKLWASSSKRWQPQDHFCCQIHPRCFLYEDLPKFEGNHTTTEPENGNTFLRPFLTRWRRQGLLWAVTSTAARQRWGSLNKLLNACFQMLAEMALSGVLGLVDNIHIVGTALQYRYM